MPSNPQPMQPSLVALFRKYPGPRFWPVWLLVGLLRLLGLFPLRLHYLLGVIIGEVVYRVFGSRRRITHKNLSACFVDKTESEITSIARAHFHYMVTAVLATGIGWWSSPRRLRRITRLRATEVFEEVVNSERRVIFLAPHFAALELGGIYMATYMLMVSMYQKNRNPLLNDLVLQYRNRFGGRQFSSKEPIKAMIQSIRRGEPLYYLPDQDPGRNKGVFAPFFGIETATFPALGRLARIARASVVPCATRIRSWGRGYEIVFLPPLENYPSGDDVSDTATMNRAIEKLVEFSPEQYLWSHKRFKTRPDGEPPFYP